MNDIFDNHLIQRRRQKSAKCWSDVDFLWQYVADDIAQRIYDPIRVFDNALEIGSRHGILCHQVSDTKVKKWTLHEYIPYEQRIVTPIDSILSIDEQFDLIVSNLNMHLISDINKHLQEVLKLMNKGAMFIATLFGESNLQSLRLAFDKAEREVLGGNSMRMHPNITMKDLAKLIYQIGFAMPVLEKQNIIVTYDSPYKLFKDIQRMGESNSLQARLKSFKQPKLILDRVANILQPDAASSFEITFEVLTISAWKNDGTMSAKTTPTGTPIF